MKVLIITNETVQINYVVDVSSLDQVPGILKEVLNGSVKPIGDKPTAATVTIDSFKFLPNT